MNRISIGGGAWFDADAAESYEESTYWDGSNRISVATGSQWAHEQLYRTARGKWLLRSWSQWQGSRDSYEEISAEHAHRWLAEHGHEEHVPAPALAALEV